MFKTRNERYLAEAQQILDNIQALVVKLKTGKKLDELHAGCLKEVEEELDRINFNINVADEE